MAANDDAARSYLNGCPDPWGTVINPFYSTRSYAECPDEAVVLESEAKAKRDATTKTATFVDVPMTYPPAGSAFPLSNYYERDAVTTVGQERLPLTFTSMHPRENSFAVTGRDVGRVRHRKNTGWCIVRCSIRVAWEPRTDPGAWKSTQYPKLWGSRRTFGITDSVSAAKYQLQTALLCDETGEHCVGADTESLQKAADGSTRARCRSAASRQHARLCRRRIPDDAAGLRGGRHKEVSAAEAGNLADVLEYATGSGQAARGGCWFAPERLRAHHCPDARAGGHGNRRPPRRDRSRRAGRARRPRGRASATRRPEGGGGSCHSPVPPVAAPVATGPTAPAAAAAAQVGTTAAAEIGFPQFGLIAGLVAAVVAGLASPVIGRRRKAGAR